MIYGSHEHEKMNIFFYNFRYGIRNKLEFEQSSFLDYCASDQFCQAIQSKSKGMAKWCVQMKRGVPAKAAKHEFMINVTAGFEAGDWQLWSDDLIIFL